MSLEPLKKWAASLAKDLPRATQAVAESTVPRVEKLIAAEFAAGADPYGDAWTPTRSGGKAFAGTNASGKVRLSLRKGSGGAGGGTSVQAIRVSVEFPMHFHNAGTKAGGKKTRKKERASLRREGYTRKAITAILKERAASRGQRLPARPIIPSNGKGIPPAWEAAIRAGASDVMARVGAKGA